MLTADDKNNHLALLLFENARSHKPHTLKVCPLPYSEVVDTSTEMGDGVTLVELKAGGILPCGVQLDKEHPGSIWLTSEDLLTVKWAVMAQGYSHSNESLRLGLQTEKPLLSRQTPNIGSGSPVIDQLVGLFDFNVTVRTISQVAAFFFLPVLYGGIHLLLSWNFLFPSACEQILWMTPCVVIISGTFYMCVCAILDFMDTYRTGWLFIYTSILFTFPHNILSMSRIFLPSLDSITVPALPSFIKLEGYRILRLLEAFTSINYWEYLGRMEDSRNPIQFGRSAFFVFLYIAARLYIVVESLISLRHVPIGVYWTPPWLQMIPHV